MKLNSFALLLGGVLCVFVPPYGGGTSLQVTLQATARARSS